MAHHVEPMDIDNEFDNKENSLHHTNVLPFTEKGYEELDVSELNMRLRYSVTPASSPMSKSYSAICADRSLESGDESLNVTVNENVHLSRSLNSTITNDNIVKSLKSLPLQSIPDSNRNSSILRSIEPTDTENANIIVTISAPSEIDDNLSLPSSSSSALHTPEATTPTTDIPIKDGGSPIMRGLKSVLNMFRSSQSPIPPTDGENLKTDLTSPTEEAASTSEAKPQQVTASTPISSHRKKEVSPTKRNSPPKDNSIVFNEDLEKELQWKDETTIIFSQERIPIHKLMLQQDNKKLTYKEVTNLPKDEPDYNSTVEYMDISYNDSFGDKTVTDIQIENNKADNTLGESDNEFLDCETTFTQNKSFIEDNDTTPVADVTQDLDVTSKTLSNDSGSRLKPIILDTTQDILDATLSIRPEDLLPEADETKDVSALILNKTETIEEGPKEIPEPISTTPILAQTEIIIVEEECKQIPEPISTTPILAQTEIIIVKEECKQIPEPISTTPILDQTEMIDVKEECKHISEPISNTPVLDQTVEITNHLTLEQQAEDLNATKTTEVGVTETIDQTFDVSNTAHEEIDLDGTTTIAKVLENTLTLEDKPKSSENLNTSVSNIIEAEATLPLDNVLDKLTEMASKIEAKLSDQVQTTIIAEIPSTPPTEAINKPLPEDIDEDIGSIESPVDIPLPDEDDQDLKLPAPEDTPKTIPIDLVDNLDAANKIVLTEINMTDEVNKIVIPETCAVINTPLLYNNTIFEGGDNVTNAPDCIEIAELGPKSIEIIAEKEIDENNYILPEVISPANLIVNEITVPIEVNDKIEDATEKAAVVHEKTEENAEQFNMKLNLNDTENQDISMNINESVCEFKPLPDIINQTITVSNTECLDLNTNIPVPIEKEQVEPCPEVIPEIDSNITEQAVITAVNDSEKVEQVIAIETENQVELPIIAPNVDSQKLPESCTKIEAIENVVDAIEIDKIEATSKETESTTLAPVSSDVQAIEQAIKDPKANTIEEEIVVSENNSPFVSVIADNIPDVKTEVDNEATKHEIPSPKVVLTPPSSPPIKSKGYNFNFDDLDFDPFATKTKIRMSPPSDSPHKSAEAIVQDRFADKPLPKKDFNRRKSQPERKKAAPKRKLNSTFSDKVNDKVIEKSPENIEKVLVDDIKLSSPPATIALEPNHITIEEDKVKDIIEIKVMEPKEENASQEELKTETEITKEAEQPIETESKESVAILESSQHELKTTSSSEQSTYYSTCTSGSEISLPSKNVFNLPEIDDINFNPFATKSKIRLSPPPSLDNVNVSEIKSSPEISVTTHAQEEPKSFEDKVETELMEKDTSGNIKNITDEINSTSSTANVPTEDEDTVEGPFLDTEDLHPDDKLSDLDTENDMMQFNELPTQSNEENLDNGEMFIDAEAFEFLLNQNKSNTVIDSGKESLFLKFDPLFAKRMSAVSSDSVLASLAKLQKRQSTPTKAASTLPKNMPSPIAGPSNLNVTQDMDMSVDYNDDLNITVSKPMMVVPPAVNPVTPRNKSLTPNRSNRRSITFTSPAMAVIDRLLSLSGNNSIVHDSTVTQMEREQNEADIALSQLRELLAEKEINVYNLRSESNDLRDRLSTLEGHVKSLEAESEDRLKKINQLNETLAEKTKINKSMAAVVEEYERTIARLIAETAQDKKRHAEERIRLINERDEQTAHLASMEVSFSDLHSKYEKSKQIIMTCKANEESYKKSIKEFEENLTKMQNNYELLKQHATSKLNHANQELEKINRSHESEVLKLKAMIKRKDLHITSLEESLAQKTKANEELTAICDELINKVG